MRDERTSGARADVPPMAWAFIGLTGAYVAAYLVIRSQTPPGGYHPPWIPDVIETAAVLLLAAAILVASDRWSAGGRWMQRAVPLLVMAGILAAVGQGHLAWMLADTTRIGEGLNPLLLARSLLEVVALAAGLAFIAVGAVGVATGEFVEATRGEVGRRRDRRGRAGRGGGGGRLRDRDRAQLRR